jgi:hypothetical protein
MLLNLSGSFNPLCKTGIFRIFGGRKTVEIGRRDLDVDVYAVNQRAADAPQIPLHGTRRAGTALVGCPKKPQGHGFIAATSIKRAG